MLMTLLGKRTKTNRKVTTDRNTTRPQRVSGIASLVSCKPTALLLPLICMCMSGAAIFVADN